MRAQVNHQNSTSEMALANVIEMWGDSPLFPGPAWRLSWPMPEPEQRQLRDSIADGRLWKTVQSMAPALAELNNPWPEDDKAHQQAAPGQWVLQAVLDLARALFEPAKIALCTPWTDVRIQPSCLLVRSTQHELAGRTLSAAANLIRTAHRQHQDHPTGREVAIIRQALAELRQHISTCCGHALTMAQLEEAERRMIPIFLIDPNQRLYQLGSGRYSHWICSTGNDRDSAFGVSIAGDKSKTHDLLRQLGLPVPQELRLPCSVSDGQLAAAARRLGYPCVLKPQDGEQGRGVTARITSQDELLEAAGKAKECTRSRLLLQQHINGHDYRLNVINGRIAFVVQRSAPVITGNGKDTVLDLIGQANLIRGRLRQQGVISANIDSEDQEVLDRIAKAGLGINSVVPRGRALQLRSNANISTGGLRADISPDCVHPVIHKQCEAIARSLRLDNCGIDYICPDISLPPMTGNGAYIEVNSMPQNSNIRSKLVLDNLFPGGQTHSISSVVIIGDWSTPQSADINALLGKLLTKQSRATIGLPKALYHQVWPLLTSNHQQLAHVYNHPREVLLDHSISYAIHFASPVLAIQRGLPLSADSEIICLTSLANLQPREAWQKLAARHNIIAVESVLS